MMKKCFLPVTILLFTLSFIQTNAAQESSKTNIAVIDLNSHGGLTQSEISSLSDRLRSLLVRTNTFDVVDRGQMEEILKEQGFQMSGCTSAECAIEAGQILGVEEMITGSIGKIGRLYTIDIVLIDVQTARIIKSITRDYQGEIEGLVALMQSITNELSGLQKAQQDVVQTGGINVTSRPDNSEVYVDNRMVGRTPLKLENLSPGEHQLKIQKSGYAPHEKRISIEAGKSESYSTKLKKIFTLKFISEPKEAEIYVNNKKIGTTPFSSSGIEGARLNIIVRKTNYKPWLKTITLLKNSEIEAKLEFTDEYKDALAKQGKDSQVKKEGGSSLWWWLGGGAVIAATAVYFLLPGDEGSDKESDEFPAPPGRP